jgi:hypothetical protein
MRNIESFINYILILQVFYSSSSRGREFGGFSVGVTIGFNWVLSDDFMVILRFRSTKPSNYLDVSGHVWIPLQGPINYLKKIFCEWIGQHWPPSNPTEKEKSSRDTWNIYIKLLYVWIIEIKTEYLENITNTQYIKQSIRNGNLLKKHHT